MGAKNHNKNKKILGKEQKNHELLKYLSNNHQYNFSSH